MELIVLLLIAIFVLTYRKNTGDNFYKFLMNELGNIYGKYAPYSFQMVREKTKELGQEYTVKEYISQITIFGFLGAVVGFLYFQSIIWAICYGLVAIAFIPFLAYLRCQRVYSEYIFEQIQVYTTNVIMEFNTTQSFVRALEGVAESGVLESPVLDDVKLMIDLSYQNGTIDESIQYFDNKYPYYMVKNMHQLFLQITKEGAKDSGESLENMLLDIDMLVEGVYRDKMDRATFHKKFLTFGFALYFLVMLTQFLLGSDNYIKMLEEWYVQFLLHAILIINTYFLINGEKFYNEDTGAE
ncbi:MAG: hypothetical protein PHH51_01225 [Bacilli bacterium]|nr:hypothetical protein [Bacilli bacterium]MDD3895424.1 hypothetical protein [Bacilli bacterium]MDD4407635.1 hypothetical protein [Bacilli bacterium]